MTFYCFRAFAMVEIIAISEGLHAIAGILGAVAFGVMLSLATFVEPQPREMTQVVPAQKLTGK